MLLRRGQFREIRVGQDDLVALRRLVGFVDIGVLNGFPAYSADAVVFDPTPILGMHLVESDVVVLGGGIYLDRDVHQPEGDRALPDRSHVITSTRDSSVVVPDEAVARDGWALDEY